jgi:hypothetical protein
MKAPPERRGLGRTEHHTEHGESAVEVTWGQAVRSPKNRHQMIFLLPRNFSPAFGFIRYKQLGEPLSPDKPQAAQSK